MSNLTTQRSMTLRPGSTEGIMQLKELVQQMEGLKNIEIKETKDGYVIIKNYTDHDLFHLGYFAAAKAFGKL